MEPKGKTLAELDVQPGDVVEVYGGPRFTVLRKDGDAVFATDRPVSMLSKDLPFRIISTAGRAHTTLAQLLAQRDALDAQIAAMPETVRVHWSMKTGFTNFCYGQSTHYRDFPIGPDGVPEGFEEVEK